MNDDLNIVDDINLNEDKEANNKVNKEDKVKESNIKFNDIKNSIYDTLGIKNANKPLICFLHIIFKILAIFNYIFGGLILNEMTLFIMIILFSLFDFWFVKNITGRLLISLRWWRILNEKGEEEWYFETVEDNVTINKIDKNIFWFSQIGIFLFWSMIFFLKLISIKLFWLTLSIISLFLTGVNLVGYYKCSKSIKKDIKKMTGPLNLISYLPKFLKS